VRKFNRKGTEVVSHLSEYEVELLRSLVVQRVELVADGDPARLSANTDDPFETLARDLDIDPDAPEAAEDPVLQRLFPTAYPHDADAASDFRRFTERDLKSKKVSEAQVVLRRLAETQRGMHEVRIPLEEAEAWLRTLTSVRLAVATRLGITDAEAAEELAELPDDDPRAFMVSVYDWLGFAQETLVSAL